MSEKYTYEVSESSVDVRSWTIESDRQLTEKEVTDIYQDSQIDDEVKKSVLVRVYKDEYIDLQEVADMNDKFVKEITEKDIKEFAIDDVFTGDSSGMKGGFSAEILEEEDDE